MFKPMSTAKDMFMQFSQIDQINGIISIQADNAYQKRWRCTLFSALSQIVIASFKESVTSKSSVTCLSKK